MLMKMRSRMQNQKGFTLVELMVVVVILGILVAIAVPVYNSVTEKAEKRSVEANLRTIDGAIMQHQATIDAPAAPTSDNLVPNFLQSWPTGPDGVGYSVKTTAATATDPVLYEAQVDFGESTLGTGSQTLAQLKADENW